MAGASQKSISRNAGSTLSLNIAFPRAHVTRCCERTLICVTYAKTIQLKYLLFDWGTTVLCLRWLVVLAEGEKDRQSIRHHLINLCHQSCKPFSPNDAHSLYCSWPQSSRCRFNGQYYNRRKSRSCCAYFSIKD